MSNNSNLSLSAKNISQYATIGSAFLGGLVGFFIGKSIGPSDSDSDSEPESNVETVSSIKDELNPSNSLSQVSEPISLSSSSSLPVGQTMGFVPVSNTTKEAQQAVLDNLENKPKDEEEEVFPSLAQSVETKPVELVAPLPTNEEPIKPITPEVPMASLEPTVNPNANEIQGGKMRSTRRKPRKPRQRASRKYGGQVGTVIVAPVS